MDPLVYTPRRAAQILGLELKELNEALRKESYTALDLLALRQKLALMPRKLGPRRQPSPLDNRPCP